MALSANAARALEQVKMGLYMLYGADYFTEEEWIKVDGLIHKGQYVFTRGPPSNVLEEPLMTFEDAIDEKSDLNLQIQSIKGQATEYPTKDNVLASEQQIPSPVSEEASTDFLAETPNETSVGGSSDEEHRTREQTESIPMFDFSETTAPNSPEPAKSTPSAPPAISSTGGLPLGYTQAQLDEVKAFNAGLTKAGQKSRPKYAPIEEAYPSPDWSQNEVPPNEATITEHAYPSPTPTEQDTRIHSWASEVNTEEPTSAVSPTLSSPLCPTQIPPQVVEQFMQAHGRKPKSTNDVFQPRNPTFRPKRPESRASSRTAKSNGKSAIAVASTGPGNPKLNVAPGTVLLAYGSTTKKSKIQLDVLSGDEIKYIKHVSGIMHTGRNLRTNLMGQFPETIVKEASLAQTSNRLLEQQRMALQTSQAVGQDRVLSATSTASNDLDRVEGANAAEWDDISIVSRPRTAAPNPVRPVGGLATSRFALLADLDSKSQASGSELFEGQGMSREEVGKMVDEKFAQILAAQQHAAASIPPTAPSRSHAAPLDETVKTVAPKTTTCWFWVTPNKGCRFTAEECHNLHAHLPSNPVSLRMGKPTWGALADAMLSTTPTSPDTSNNDLKFSSKSRTCWYWATDGKCNNTAETCKYLHEYTPNGVASRPSTWKRRDFNWERKNAEDIVGEGELVSKEVNSGWENGDETASAWGDGATSWESPADRYKPPHIKAIEEKAKIEATGW